MPAAEAVEVKADAAMADSNWMQAKLKKLVWSSGCTSWALDPETGLNIAMYPEYQFSFWLRSIFIPGGDFQYVDRKTGKARSLTIGGWKTLQSAQYRGGLRCFGLRSNRVSGSSRSKRLSVNLETDFRTCGPTGQAPDKGIMYRWRLAQYDHLRRKDVAT